MSPHVALSLPAANLMDSRDFREIFLAIRDRVEAGLSGFEVRGVVGEPTGGLAAPSDWVACRAR